MAISLNYTSFASKGFEIRQAMHTVLTTGEAVRLKNRHGQHWLLIVLHKDTLGYTFRFLDNDNRDVGHMILKAAVRVWSDLDMEVFWRLNAEAYDLKEHPLVTVARQAELERPDRLAKLHRATHKVITYGGAVIGYGGWQRDWLGRKRFYLVADKQGLAYGKTVKMTTEAFLMVARLEVLA